MRRIVSGLTLGLALGVVSGWSSPLCTDQSLGGVGGNTLQNYINLGAGGCTLNSILFANFAYSYSLGTDAFYVAGPTGTGTNQTASVVTVSVNSANTALLFNGNWVVNHYQTANLSLSFSVSAPSPLVNTLINTFAATQGGTQNGGPTSALAATCSGGTCGPTNFTNSSQSIGATNGPLNIVNTAVMNAQGSTNGSQNNYHLSIITDQFAPTALPLTGTPEPAGLALVGLGLGALGFFRRRLIK